MKIMYFIILFFLIPGAVNGQQAEHKEEDISYKNATVEACYSLGMSAAIVNCMGSLAGESKVQYNKEYRNFVAWNAKNKKDLIIMLNLLRRRKKQKNTGMFMLSMSVWLQLI